MKRTRVHEFTNSSIHQFISFLFLVLFLPSCSKDCDLNGIDFPQEMRNLVSEISRYAKETKPGFIVIPQNGIELVSKNLEPDGIPDSAYLASIDGCGQEDLFFGYDHDDEATPSGETAWLRSFLDIAKGRGKTILVTDYCSTPSRIDQSYALNEAAGYIGFAATERGLNVIPSLQSPIWGENNAVVASLTGAKNFLYLIDPGNYLKKQDFIQAVTATNYDILIMDLFFTAGSAFVSTEIDQLRMKANGGRRLVIAYMSIGEAEDYRWYWQPDWKPGDPDWLCKENPDWEGNYKVEYWNPAWKQIIYGTGDSYLDKILAAGFDGVYLDLIDAYEYFE